MEYQYLHTFQEPKLEYDPSQADYKPSADPSVYLWLQSVDPPTDVQSPPASPPLRSQVHPVHPPANSKNPPAGPPLKPLNLVADASLNSQNAQAGHQPNSKNVIIIGGARGIGRYIARHLLEKGHRVYLLDTNVAGVAEFLDKYLPAGSGVGYGVGEYRHSSDIHTDIDTTCQLFFPNGRIDALINNTGLYVPNWPDGTHLGNPIIKPYWPLLLDANLTVPFLAIQACIPHMKIKGLKANDDPGACIINIPLYCVPPGAVDCEGYMACRAGLIGLTEYMIPSCRRWGIRVSCITPGPKELNIGSGQGKMTWECYIETDYLEIDYEQPVDRRMGTAEDIAMEVEYVIVGAAYAANGLTRK